MNEGKLEFEDLSNRYIAAFQNEAMKKETSVIGFRFIPIGEELPTDIEEPEEKETWCKSGRRADTERISRIVTLRNVGCVAAAITLGLIDENDPNPLPGGTCYTNLMPDKGKTISPMDFTDGTAYACKACNRPKYSLFNKPDFQLEDCGRYETREAALNAIRRMAKIQPATIEAVVIAPPGRDIEPDGVIIRATPRDATRVIQAYAYQHGRAAYSRTVALRGYCADLTAAPFIDKIKGKERLHYNVLCLGARAIAGFGGNQMAFGLSFGTFKYLVEGMEKSRGGFPDQVY